MSPFLVGILESSSSHLSTRSALALACPGHQNSARGGEEPGGSTEG